MLLFLLVCVATGTAVVSLWSFWPYTLDDSFITLRYAENAFRYGALNYNADGPRAEGYTSLLWTALLILPHAAGWSAVPVAKILSITALAAAAGLTVQLANRIALRHGASTGAGLTAIALIWLVAFAPSSVHAVSGMETSLYTLFLTGFFNALYKNATEAGSARPGLFLWGLAAGLTRPEGNAIAALGYVLLFAWASPAQRKHLVARALCLHVLLYAGYFGFRAAYYETLWPLPFYIKVVRVMGWPGAAWVKAFLVSALLPLLPALAAGAWALRRKTDRDRGLWAVISCVVFSWLLFMRASHLMGGEHRFLFPSFPTVCALAAAALQLFWHQAQSRPSLRLAVTTGCALLPVVLFSQTLKPAYQSVSIYARGLAQAHQVLGLRLAAAVGAGQAPSQCRLAFGDAGIVPYLSRWKTLDTFGLNDAHIATTKDHSAEYILAWQPDVWVLLSSSKDTFNPLLPWERDFLGEAQAHGYDFSRRLKFDDLYYLWVGQRAGNARAPCQLQN